MTYLKNPHSPKLMGQFPDFSVKGFDIEKYNDNFKNHNIIIRAKAKHIAYPEHWGCLSIKTAFGGTETYLVKDHIFAVNDSNYLIFNEGKTYASFIDSPNEVSSFTINFATNYVNEILNNLLRLPKYSLDSPDFFIQFPFQFVEKLYSHNSQVSPILFRLAQLSQNWTENEAQITEEYYNLLEAMILNQANVYAEVAKIQAVKKSTQFEIYKRLNLAKDYLDSCYTQNISLDTLAEITCLNPYYFLRQFKIYFKITPHAYLQQKRLQIAQKLLKTTHLSITEICFQVGYNDLSSFSKLFKLHFGLSPEKYSKIIIN